MGSSSGGDAGAEARPGAARGCARSRPARGRACSRTPCGARRAPRRRRHTISVCDLDAVDRAHHEHRQVGDAQRRLHVTDEVGVARRVDEVDLVAFAIRTGRWPARSRCRRFCSSGSVVGDGGAVLDPADPVDGPGSGEQRLGRAWSCRCPRAPPGPRCGSCRSGTLFMWSVPPGCRDAGPHRSPETLSGVDRVDRAGVEERMLPTGGSAPPPTGSHEIADAGR